MKKFLATISVISFVLISICVTNLFAVMATSHHASIVNHECCDFNPAHHNDDLDAGAIFLTFIVPAAIFLFTIAPLALRVNQSFQSKYSPYFHNKFAKGILQLE